MIIFAFLFKQGRAFGGPPVFICSKKVMQLRQYKEQYKQLLKLAAPVMFAQMGIAAVQLFDNGMVGRLGALPLAAVAFGGTVFFMVFIFATGIVISLTPLVGEQYAQGRYRAAAVYFQNSFVLFLTIGIIAFCLQMSLIPLMYHMGQPVEVVEMAIPYYRYLVWSIIPYILFGSFKQFLEGIGNTRANMVIIIACNLINIFFNWLLIFGNWGFPRMEAAGAGLATLISRICMPLFAAGYFAAKPRLRRYFRYFKRENFTWEKIWTMLKVGFPIASQMLLEGAAFALTTLMMGWLGTVTLAANQVTMTVSNFAFMIVLGLGSAATIRVSHEYGRGNLRELKKSATAAYHLTLAYSTITATFFILFGEQIAGLFTSDPEVIAMASYLMIFVAAFQFSDGLQSVSVGILRGMQDVKQVMIIAVVSYIIINLPIAYFCAFVLKLGPGGLWAGFIFGLSVAAFLLITRLRQQLELLRRKQIEARRGEC